MGYKPPSAHEVTLLHVIPWDYDVITGKTKPGNQPRTVIISQDHVDDQVWDSLKAMFPDGFRLYGIERSILPCHVDGWQAPVTIGDWRPMRQ